MKHRRMTSRAIIVMLFAGGLIAVSSWAFAQGSITGSVRDRSNNRGIQGAIITARDVSTDALAGTDTTDALGNYISWRSIPGKLHPPGVKNRI